MSMKPDDALYMRSTGTAARYEVAEKTGEVIRQTISGRSERSPPPPDKFQPSASGGGCRGGWSMRSALSWGCGRSTSDARFQGRAARAEYRADESGCAFAEGVSRLIVRRVYGIVRGASLLAAVVATAVWGPAAVRALRADDVAFLAGALAVTLALGWLRAPAAHFERSVRPTPESDRIGLLTPLLIAVLVREGWFWAGLCAVVAQLVRPPGLRRRPFVERVVTATLRVPALWAGALVAAPLHAAAVGTPSFAALAVFAGFGSAY